MSEVIPFLRLTASEINCVRQELTVSVENWRKQWCTMPVEMELERVELDVLSAGEYALRWGTRNFWAGIKAPDSLHALLNVVLFNQIDGGPAHPLAQNVFRRAERALLAELLSQEQVHENNAPEPPMRGSSLRLWIRAEHAEAALILSPSLLADILENRLYVAPLTRWQGYGAALAATPLNLRAVLGSATVSFSDFMALETGDVIGLDLAEKPCLMSEKGVVAAVTPCLKNKHQAVLINNFFPDRKSL